MALIGNYSVLNKTPGRWLSGGSTAGTNQAQARGNWSNIGPARCVHYQDGETAAKKLWGVPEGAYCCYATLLPYTQGMITSRYEADFAAQASATGVLGLPSSGSSQIEIAATNSGILPVDDTSPLRTASAVFEITSSATGELRMSGAGSASVSVSVVSAALVGILQAIGTASVSVSTNAPILGAEAGGSGSSEISLSATATALPDDDTSPVRTASAMIYITGTLSPYALGHMVGFALPYTELSPQSLASAVWQAQASENNLAGTMGSKVNAASSGGVDMDALAEAVWEYTP